MQWLHSGTSFLTEQFTHVDSSLTYKTNKYSLANTAIDEFGSEELCDNQMQ